MEPENKQENIETASVKETVLRKIDTQEVSMHSKKYFALRAGLFAALVVIVLSISAFMFSFIFFNLRASGHGYLLSFGPQGIWLFLKFFPWGLLVLDVICVAVLEWLLRKFRFAYRVPTLYLLLALLLAAALIGLAVDRGTPFNDHMAAQADIHGLPPPLNDLYAGFHQPPPPEKGVCNCIITGINGTKIIAYEKNDAMKTVTISAPPNEPVLPLLGIGDTVFVAGHFYGGVLHAFGLRLTETPPPAAQMPAQN